MDKVSKTEHYAPIAMISNGLADSKGGHVQWLGFYVPHINGMQLAGEFRCTAMLNILNLFRSY